MSLVPEIDYGTPASRAEKMVTLTIDGNEITVPEGTSIMRASMEAGIKVPKLCATDMVDAFGSCRLCLVEVEGRNGTPASCTTPVAPGLVVHTQARRHHKERAIAAGIPVFESFSMAGRALAGLSRYEAFQASESGD